MGRQHVIVISLVVLLAGCSDDGGGDSAPATSGPPATAAATPAATAAPASTEATMPTTVESTTPATVATTTVPASTTTTTVASLYSDHVSAQYAGTNNWICHPDLATDECRDLGATVIAADGSSTVEQLAPTTSPDFDCFYLYPTTSTDPGPNSDLVVDASETDTVRAQVARYSSVCRVFAPVYRSITLGALAGGASEEHREIAYADVLDAWRSYVVDHNPARGVVLIGHSQGASWLGRLLAEEIGPDPAARDLLVSAVLLGSSVPRAGFEGIPPCSSADEPGCVVSYSTYPAAAPPTEGALFGRERDTGEPALCVDPAALLGGDGVVDAVLPTRLSLLGGVAGFEELTTPFVKLPGAVRIACAEANGYGYLAVQPAGVPGDVRNLAGLVEQRLGPVWGLHLLDANVAQDALIELVTRQAASWPG